MRQSLITLYAALSLAMAALLAAMPAKAAVTELKANQGGHFIADAEINGTAVQVLVDTGATAVAHVKIERITIDNVRVEDVEALVLPEGALQGTLLGMTFLSRLGSFKVEDGILYMKD